MGAGVIFRFDPSGLVTVLHSFTGGDDGASPPSSVIQAADGRFYGTTPAGGASGFGTVFRIDTAGTLTTLHAFSGGDDGASPYAGLFEGHDGSFYGTTSHAGASGGGTVFRIDPGGTLTTLHSFAGAGEPDNFAAGVIQGADGSLYGTTPGGGAVGRGTIFRLDMTGTLTTLHSFIGGAEGYYPRAALMQAVDGNFYGTTLFGGPSGHGTVFMMDATGTVTTIHGFGNADSGFFPNSALIQGPDGSLYGTTREGNYEGPSFGGSIFKIDASGTITTLHSFTFGVDAGYAYGGVTQGSDGDFYGTTAFGGTDLRGRIFKIDATGVFTTLHSFSGGSNGEQPRAPLVQAADGNLYGTTEGTPFSATSAGTVFKLDASGTVTTLHAFAGGSEGAFPRGRLTQGADGSFYGATMGGGANFAGTIFKIDPTGTLSTLHAFSFGIDGSGPTGGLILAADGSLYGTTMSGGPSGAGTIFKLDPAGTLTTLHAFDGGRGGGQPFAGLLQASDGNFYGATWQGGTSNRGTVFRLDAAGTLITLHEFRGGFDGGYPYAPLIQMADGHLYGTTSDGTVYRLDAAGALTTVFRFSGATAWYPYAGVTQAADGRLYGTTLYGGPTGGGAVYRLIVRDADDDGDGILNRFDAFLWDPTESIDTDGDGIGDNGDNDDDGDGVADAGDAFPYDSAESADTDHDGVGDNADAFWLNPAETLDTDGDGVGNNADADDDGDHLADVSDNCPLVPNAGQEDNDGDGHGAGCDYGDAVNGPIAFASRRDGNFEIYSMNPDGTGQLRLTNNPASDTLPVWSPDGTRIAFLTTRNSESEIWIMNADGTGQARLASTAAQDTEPAWSPDGTQLAVAGRVGDITQIYVIDANGSGRRRLTTSWAGDEYDSTPSWSPDGRTIVFSRWDYGSADVYVINADGSGETRLTTGATDEGAYPAWSSDSTKIAFQSGVDGEYEIEVMDANGGNRTRITNNDVDDGRPAWSPDGTKIVFSSLRDGNREIYSMNADGTAQTRLTNHPASDNAPSWGPAPLLDTDGDGSVDEDDADDDGDGIEDIVDTQRLVTSNAFSDLPLGGTTSGTITSRGGWTVAVTDAGPGGVRIGVSGGGTVATLATCANGGAESVELDGNGETATVECVNTTGINTGSRVTAVLATAPAADPRVIVKESVGRIRAMLSTGSIVTVGSPVTAGSNAAAIPVELLDTANVVIGSFQLDANESVDVKFVAAAGGEEVHVTVLQGSVPVTVFGRTQTLTPASGETIFAPIPPTPTVKDLITQVNALPISNSAKTPLLAILEAADRATEKGKRTPQLKAFIVQIQNLARKGQLSAAVASDLIAQAQAIAGA